MATGNDGVVKVDAIRRRQAKSRRRDLPMWALQSGHSLDAGVTLATRFSRFRLLVDHPLYSSIHGRIVSGESPYTVARWVQDQVSRDDPLGTDTIKFLTLRQRLVRYKALLPASAFLAPSYLDELTKRVNIHIDVVNELGGLIWYQKQRISQFAENEKQFPLGITAEQQRKEVETLAKLLAQMRDTQIQLGITPGTMPAFTAVTQNVALLNDDEQDPLTRLLGQNPSLIPRVMAKLDEAFADDVMEGTAIAADSTPANRRA